MPEPLLRLRGLRKSFGALTVTDDLGLDVAEGELHAVIGPNGAGKTTLIEQISGFAQPDAGRILFASRDVTELAPYRRARLGLARTFQITSILDAFTVLENVAMAVQAQSGSSLRFFRAAAADAALNDAAAEALARVGLAGRPRLLLLDEPLAGTSHGESAALIALLRSLKQHVAMVLVEHDMDAVFALADRVTVLVYGRAVASGTPACVRAHPEVRRAYLGDEA
jgi:branched-chain amino acid transport system ATP-binding protein